MKYIVINNLEFYYDDLEKNEILLFSAPDEFQFTTELAKKFWDSTGLEYRIREEHYIEIKVSTRKWIAGGIADLVENDDDYRKQFFEWLKQMDVVLLPFEKY